MLSIFIWIYFCHISEQLHRRQSEFWTSWISDYVPVSLHFRQRPKNQSSVWTAPCGVSCEPPLCPSRLRVVQTDDVDARLRAELFNLNVPHTQIQQQRHTMFLTATQMTQRVLEHRAEISAAEKRVNAAHHQQTKHTLLYFKSTHPGATILCLDLWPPGTNSNQLILKSKWMLFPHVKGFPPGAQEIGKKVTLTFDYRNLIKLESDWIFGRDLKEWDGRTTWGLCPLALVSALSCLDVSTLMTLSLRSLKDGAAECRENLFLVQRHKMAQLHLKGVFIFYSNSLGICLISE